MDYPHTLAEYQRAFAERTAQYTRAADECITLTNERDALRDALRNVLNAEILHSALVIAKARRVLQDVTIRENGFSPCPVGGVCTNPKLCADLGACCAGKPAPTGIVGNGPGDTAF